MFITLFNKILLLSTLLSFLSCNSTTPQEENLGVQASVSTHSVAAKKVMQPIDSSKNNKYSWKDNIDARNTLVNRFPLPSGFTRTQVAEGSFGDWLRHLPLKAEGSKVFHYDGGEKHPQNVHAAVVDIDTGNRDLQQCADAVMRVKAEYHYSKNEYSKIHFNYTSGDKVAFNDWRQGRKPRIQGNKVVFSGKTGSVDNSYRNFKKYMTSIFSYAGTASLSKELQPIQASEMQIGDIFIRGGFPGHAVIVVDMAEHTQTGQKLFMVAQSYMPAQDFHVLKNPTDGGLSPWYDLNYGESLQTPEWSFSSSELKRFKD